ncbi:MAG: P44/Msp2 family outer membrane protein [Anaplasma sp.]
MESIRRVAMYDKATKVRIFIVAFGVLCFPLQALSDDTLPKQPTQSTQRKRVYFSGAYKNSFPDFGALDVKEREFFMPNVRTITKMTMEEGVIANIDNHVSFADYRRPFYNGDYLGFSAGMGYSIGPVRLELVRAHSEFQVKGNIGMANKENASNIALVRDTIILSGNYVVVKNKKIGVSSTTLSVCYDMEGMEQAAPYVCLGVSGNLLDLLNTRKVSYGYQGKIGVGIKLTPDTVLFFGGHYDGILNYHFDPIALTIPKRFNKMPKPSAAEADVRLAYLGGELGIRHAF